jgi:hypothetical protein
LDWEDWFFLLFVTAAMLCALDIGTDMIRAGLWMELDCWIEFFLPIPRDRNEDIVFETGCHRIEKASLFGCCKPRDNSHGVFKINAAS